MRNAIGITCAVTIISAAHAVEIPKPLSGDQRLGELNYSAAQVFQIPVKKGIATHVIMASDERIVASAPGQPSDCRNENSDWCIVSNVGASDFYVRVNSASAISNNLELRTSKRMYSFNFVQGSGAAMFRVTFRYVEPAVEERSVPVASLASAATSTAANADESTPVVSGAVEVAARSCNWRYSMQAAPGSGVVAPLAAFDDGKNTYLMFAPGADLPRVSVVARDGSEMVVRPKRMPGNFAVLPGVGSLFMLRGEDAAVGVWNDGATISEARGMASACPDWVVA